MKRNNKSTTASSSSASAAAGADDNNKNKYFPLHPPQHQKMSTRGNGISQRHRENNDDDEARDPRGEGRARSLSFVVSSGVEGAEASQREGCDGGIPLDCSTKKKAKNKATAAIKIEIEARTTEEKRKRNSKATSSNNTTLEIDLASPASFDQEAMLQVVPSTYSFGGLSALKIDGGSGSGSYNGGGGGDATIVDPNVTTSPANPTIDDLTLMDDNINHSSWDLLNQADSFGFNLLGSQGSLSFEHDQDIGGGGGGGGAENNNDTSKEKVNGGNEKPIVDLTTTVTATLDDHFLTTPTKQTSSREGGTMETTIVNNSLHNWIPPNCSLPPPPPPTQQQHRNKQHGEKYSPHLRPTQPHLSNHGGLLHQRPTSQSNYPYYNAAPHQYRHLPESRSDVPQYSSYNFMDEELREDTIGGNNTNKDSKHKKDISNSDSLLNFDNDPFKYAFGDPKKIAATTSSAGGKGGRSRKSHGGGTVPTASGQAKKRKQEDRSHGSSRAPAPSQSSKLPVTMVTKGMSDPRNRHHQRVDKGSGRSSAETNRLSQQHQQHNSVMHYQSKCHQNRMTWHDPSANDPIQNAFLPPVPSSGPAQQQKHPSAPRPPASYHNPPPCKEVYITTQTPPTMTPTSMAPAPVGRRGAYQPPIVAAQYAHHHYHNPPYNYPPHSNAAPPMAMPPPFDPANMVNQAPRPTLTSRIAAVSPVISSRQHPPQQRHKPTKGVALLALRNGKQLSRTQAPGIGWPHEEDLRLTEIMSNHKSSHVDWDALCKEPGLAGRTARECHDRWTRYLKPGSRKGQWTEEEDAIVLRSIFSNGGLGGIAATTTSTGVAQEAGGVSSSFTQWADLAPQLPGRTGKQIRDRWVNYLNPAINHLPFSREDDLLLWQGHKEHGKRWVEISVKVFHSTRSENHIKNRWYSAAFKKFIAKEFGVEAYVDSKQHEGGNRKGDDDTNMS